MKEDDAYWESVVNESSRIAKQYGDSKFVIGLLLTVIEELERIYKEMRNSAETYNRV